MSDSETILTVENLTKSFPLNRKQRKERGIEGDRLLAVDGLSFHLDRGEIFALLGPNGAGKTTTLRMLAGLLNPTEGAITLFGDRLNRQSNDLRSRIGFLTSDLKLDPFFTPNYLFDFFSALHLLSKDEINRRKKELFSYFGIDTFANTKVGNLSTGMKQKVSLAISLCNDPDLIIFDEPTNGLDILAAKSVEDYLIDLRRRGKTAIISTHIFSLVDKLADRVLIILNGRKAYEGEMSEVGERGGIESVFFSCYEGGQR